MRIDRILDVAKRESRQFFVSPLGYLFLAVFAAITLFRFFWVDAFFARNLADVRPLFEWLPLVLIFLCAALTMRMWSEEKRSGTLEFIATLPVSTAEVVLGKFLACWFLVATALALTLPLPITVSLIGSLDWGPVWAGYLAALLLGGTYLALGLTVSAMTQSQIVSLIGASAIGVVFWLVGSEWVAGFFGGGLREFFLQIGAGSRFESISRGLLDMRDLYFYASVMASALAVNCLVLERQRWDHSKKTTRHLIWTGGTALLAANLLIANVWLSQISALRVDTTEGEIYSLSDVTLGYLDELDEPLLIRGYFTERTHPALTPLVPRMRDLLLEFEEAGGSNVTVELIDPTTDPEAENEANSRYGIRAVPFQVSDRHQARLVNSYFDVLVEYGGEYEVLGFRDMIEIKLTGESDLDVRLKNPEFDLTRTIKNVLSGFRSGGDVVAGLSEPVNVVGYVSSVDQLPEALGAFRAEVEEMLARRAADSSGNVRFEMIDPEAGDGSVAAQIAEQYGFAPMAVSLFDEGRFYFYLTMQNSDTVVQLPLPPDLTIETVERSLDEGLKRFVKGVLPTVALSAPVPVPQYMQQPGMPSTNEYNQLHSALSQEFSVVKDDLTSGTAPHEAQVLVVVDADGLAEKQVFAIDQFLMKGGTVVLATGAYASQASQSGLSAQWRNSGLDDWLFHHGVTVEPTMVLDQRSAAFPVPVTRSAGGYSFQELVLLDYPYFADVRQDAMATDAAFLAGVPQMTLTWASPISIADDSTLSITPLMTSSEESWVSDDLDITPRFDESGLSLFEPEGDIGARAIAVKAEGRFESFFADRPSPLNVAAPAHGAETEAEGTQAEEESVQHFVPSVIRSSPESARLIVFGSNDFMSDQMLELLGAADGTAYVNSLQMMVNAVDWTTEDSSLVSIRARAHFNRTLDNLDVDEQKRIEQINYGVIILMIGLIAVVSRWRLARRREVWRGWMAAGEQS